MLLQNITERALYLPGANNIGVVATDGGGAIVIDTGLDKNVARKLRKALDDAGLALHAIINTHHHADHTGGNDYLLRNLPGVQVYAPPLEATIIENPLLEPTYLNYGAVPMQALRTRWLLAPGSPVHHLIGDVEHIWNWQPMPLEVAGITFEVLPLPGHSIAQVGLSYDGVCFAADGFFGPAVVARHGVLYAHDIAAQLASFDYLHTRDEAWFLPGHGTLTPRAELDAALEANRAATMQASELVLQALAEPGTIDALTVRLLRLLDEQQVGESRDIDRLAAMNIPQYAIFAGAVAAHLSFLEQQERVRATLDEHGLRWFRLT